MTDTGRDTPTLQEQQLRQDCLFVAADGSRTDSERRMARAMLDALDAKDAEINHLLDRIRAYSTSAFVLLDTDPP